MKTIPDPENMMNMNSDQQNMTHDELRKALEPHIMRSGSGTAIWDERVRDGAWACVLSNTHQYTEDESNYACARKALSLINGGHETDGVIDARFGGSFGPIEHLLVDTNNYEKSLIAWDIIKSLEGYPILDDNDMSERQEEEKRQIIQDEFAHYTSNGPGWFTDEDRNNAAQFARDYFEIQGGWPDELSNALPDCFAYGVTRVILAWGTEWTAEAASKPHAGWRSFVPFWTEADDVSNPADVVDTALQHHLDPNRR